MKASAAQRTGVVIGGSGLVGGTLLAQAKSIDGLEILAPNSKELSLRVPEDVSRFFRGVRPDFIVNCAIAAIDADPRFTLEVNVEGALRLARVALELGIPYVHTSSGAVMCPGSDVSEDERLPLVAALPNYAKAKLLAEHALETMHREEGLDYTCIRLGIVYGAHDHKIQGFQRLLFSLVSQAVPFLLTRRDAAHSYTNARKLPAFVWHVLAHRDEFAGETLHFVDAEPVPLGELILAIREQLGTRRPLRVYVSYALARVLAAVLVRVTSVLRWAGIDARPPAELQFLESFYASQVLSAVKLQRSSFVDAEPEATVLRELPDLIDYYVPRWDALNLIDARREPSGVRDRVEAFEQDPERLLATLLAERLRMLEAGAEHASQKPVVR